MTLGELHEPVKGTDVCMMMHTALRKHCDSKISSAAYNLVCLICDSGLPGKFSPWRLLGKLVAEKLNEGEDPTRAVQRCVNQLDDAYFDQILLPRRKAGKKVPKNAYSWLYALKCTFQCFDENDWAGVAALLEKSKTKTAGRAPTITERDEDETNR